LFNFWRKIYQDRFTRYLVISLVVLGLILLYDVFFTLDDLVIFGAAALAMSFHWGDLCPIHQTGRRDHPAHPDGVAPVCPAIVRMKMM